ncbi:hypothetical protein NFI96_001426 [Prochilodus magdalenae]|nr:hypothetical protein NFI96_001426 [Prochilodus magdalenae]
MEKNVVFLVNINDYYYSFQASLPLEDSMSEKSLAQGGMMGISEKLHSFLEDRERSEIFLGQHLEFLKTTQRQQLQQIELQHQAGLERRILQNSLLSENADSQTSGPQKTTCSDGSSVKSRGGIYMFNKPKRSSSTPDLSTKMKLGKSFDPVMPQTRGSRREALLQAKESNQSRFDKEEIDWAECQKQFRVAPVPEHVYMSLYDSIVSEQERMRQEGRQQRRELLLSMQKPFTFHQREQKKDKPKQEPATDKQSEIRKHTGGRKAVPKAVTDPAISEHLKEEEKKRKIRIQARAQETLRASSAPIQSQAPRADGQQSRTSQKTKSKVLGFLEQRPSFRPVIIAQVPDFDKQYQAFQRKLMETSEKREVTLCRPFQLRTSTLQPRHSRSSTDKSLSATSKSSLKRSSSFGGLTSLSMDTLPTYITDAARKRSMAIRKSLELRDNKEQENAEWMKQHRINSQAMSKAVAARAKALDPHTSLKEADQERVKDYKRELREMRTRVTARPYLFEQVSQKNAKSDAERRYRTTLEQAGLDENFVRSKGENDEDQTSKNKDTDSDSDDDQHSSECDTQQRLFELDPSLLSLFNYKTNCGVAPECLSSPEFLEHVTKVMLVIDAAVSHLEDLHTLEEFLLNLGKKHQAVGVKTQSFAEVGEALLYMLQCSLGAGYTAALRQAWLNMYSIVVSAMTRGWAKNGEHNKLQMGSNVLLESSSFLIGTLPCTPLLFSVLLMAYS